MRWQERVEKEVKYFRYWRVGHCKWECSNMVVEKERRKNKKAAYVTRPQKAQQERRLVCPVWEKVQEYCEKWNMPPEGVLLLERRWTIEEIVVTYVDCREYKDKRVQTHKNQGQGFLLKRQVKKIWYNTCQEV